MNVSILSLRDSDPNVVFTLTFNVMFGPPSHVYCAYNGQGFFSSREHPHLSRKVIRSQYLSSSQPDMTRVTLTVEQPIKEGRTYACAIIAEGRTHIVSSTEYNYFKMGTEGISTVYITGELMSAILIYNTHCSHSLSLQLQAHPLLSLQTGLATTLSCSSGLLHHHLQLGMSYSISPQLLAVGDSVEETLAILS